MLWRKHQVDDNGPLLCFLSFKLCSAPLVVDGINDDDDEDFTRLHDAKAHGRNGGRMVWCHNATYESRRERLAQIDMAVDFFLFRRMRLRLSSHHCWMYLCMHGSIIRVPYATETCMHVSTCSAHRTVSTSAWVVRRVWCRSFWPQPPWHLPWAAPWTCRALAAWCPACVRVWR